MYNVSIKLNSHCPLMTRDYFRRQIFSQFDGGGGCFFVFDFVLGDFESQLKIDRGRDRIPALYFFAHHHSRANFGRPNSLRLM